MHIDISKLSLISPSTDFHSAFQQFYFDFVHNDPSNADFYSAGNEDFTGYVGQLINESKGKNLLPGYVPCSHFWLIDGRKEIHGALRVRHNLNSKWLQNEGGHIGYDIKPSSRRKGFGSQMLRLGLYKAQSLGIDSIMVTADDDNVGSRKVIEANGGRLENIVKSLDGDVQVARYWIDM
ncbi:GNAT family N-acetyltransferase [Vibrio sp. S4M6]|uniref:GNAT family N-acetyltransferase n=1 Tax=Vibrio sinus TaxID=2946865 RepID=UPI00202AB8AD|nr:GNAT family N-acetyltransferase [Vibrio sinus]MCL9782006.1 GNAT family N-acetyltransferase [Vibrio sinus]